MTPEFIKLQENVSALSKALETKAPNIRVLCHTIHTALKQDDQLVTMFSEEEIATCIKGLEVVSGQEVLFTTAKSKGSKASLRNIGVDDL